MSGFKFVSGGDARWEIDSSGRVALCDARHSELLVRLHRSDLEAMLAEMDEDATEPNARAGG